MSGARADVVVVGAGHNGLIAAVLLARAGLDVAVFEAAGVVGGAARTEYPFAAVPGLGHSTGAYLLGLMPPELITTLGLDLPLLRRDPHYALPSETGSANHGGGRPALVLGADPAANAAALAAAFSPADARADAALGAELDALRADLAPAWLAEPLSVEGTAERYVRACLRDVFVALCRGSVLEYLDRFGFASERLVAMYAVTDGLSGVSAGPDDPGTGHNFLAHNSGRLPGSNGTWMIVRGGMGTVTGALADAARAAGARILTGNQVERITTSDGTVTGVELVADSVEAGVVLAACDPFRLPGLVGGGVLPADLTARLDRLYRPGSTLKVNLALRRAPEFPSVGRPTGGATVHLLPGGDAPLAAVRAMWADVSAGRLPAFPTIEWYVHTTVDPSLQDAAGHHSSALFVQSVPYTPAGSSWAAELDGYVAALLEVCDRFAPGTSASVADVLALPPPGISERFGITGGHIHHVDNTVAFDERMPYTTGVAGLYAGSAGCHPAGSVIGAAGHNAARRILSDLGHEPGAKRPRR